jgi:hypothetical protein
MDLNIFGKLFLFVLVVRCPSPAPPPSVQMGKNNYMRTTGAMPCPTPTHIVTSA